MFNGSTYYLPAAAVVVVRVAVVTFVPVQNYVRTVLVTCSSCCSAAAAVAPGPAAVVALAAAAVVDWDWEPARPHCQCCRPAGCRGWAVAVYCASSYHWTGCSCV